jgi:hypothetical protein
MELTVAVIAVHAFLILIIYFRDSFYGLHSAYALSVLILIFVPLAYNFFLFKEYQSTLAIHLSLLFSTFLISQVKVDYSVLLNLLKGTLIASKLLNLILLLTIVYTIIILILGLFGLGYLMRLPTIGFYALSVLMMFYSYHFRELYGGRYLAFFVLMLLQFLVFFFLLWTGYGRLLLFQFFTLTVFFGSFYINKVKQVKFFIIMTIPLMVGVGGALRHQEGGIMDAIVEGEGVGSILVPLKYTELVYEDIMSENIQHLNGSSYLATVLFFVPRQLWDDKPVGFGKTLVEWYMPAYYDTGHSLAGTFLAEAIGNFGVLGLVIAPILIFLMFKMGTFLISGKVLDFQGFTSLLVFSLFLAGISDFVWGGSLIFISRACIAAASLLIVFWIVSRK